MKYTLNLFCMLSLILLFDGCTNKISLSKEFILEGKISISDFYSNEIAESFSKLTSNELGSYCPLSFDIKDNSFFIPSKVQSEIKEFNKVNNKLFPIKVIKTKNKPDFIELMKDDSWYYSSYVKHSIFKLDKTEILLSSSADIYFKNCTENIVYSSGFYFFNNRHVVDSIYYENIYDDWDYFLLPTKQFLVLSLSHENNIGCTLEIVNASLTKKILRIDNAEKYNTFKILGVYKDNIVLLLANEETIEIIFCDLNSLTILQRIKRSNPFNIELMMGDYSNFWPNQFICKMKQNKIYLLGTSREELSFFSLDIN